MDVKKKSAVTDAIALAQVEDKVIAVRGQNVLLDSDVAALYAVETREINQAVLRNPDKFPEGYIVQLSKDEWQNLRSQFVILREAAHGQHPKYPPKAFTEKGLYMLATILKGERAAKTTLVIVETFAKIRELSQTVAALAKNPDGPRQKSLMQRGGEIIADLIDSDLTTSGTETTIEINLAFVKIKHTVQKKISKTSKTQ